MKCAQILFSESRLRWTMRTILFKLQPNPDLCNCSTISVELIPSSSLPSHIIIRLFLFTGRQSAIPSLHAKSFCDHYHCASSCMCDFFFFNQAIHFSLPAHFHHVIELLRFRQGTISGIFLSAGEHKHHHHRHHHPHHHLWPPSGHMRSVWDGLAMSQ